MVQIKKAIIMRCLIAIAVFVAVFCAGYSLGLQNAGNASSAGSKAGAVREQLEQAAVNQRQLTTDLWKAKESNYRLANELGNSATAVSRSAKAADSIAAANSDINHQLEEAGNLIASSQRILERVLGRAKADQAPH